MTLAQVRMERLAGYYTRMRVFRFSSSEKYQPVWKMLMGQEVSWLSPDRDDRLFGDRVEAALHR